MGVGLVLVFAASFFSFVFHDTFLKVFYQLVLDDKVFLPPSRDRDQAAETDVSLDRDRIGRSRQVFMRQHLLTANKLDTAACHCKGLETMEFSAGEWHRPG